MSEMNFPVVQGASKLTTTIPLEREWVLKHPGNINFADSRGAYPGCKLVSFDTVDEANEFFRGVVGLLVVDIQIGSRIFMLISKQMDDDEMEEFQAYQSFVAIKMREWTAAKDKEKADVAAAEAKAQADAEAFLKEARQVMKEHADLVKAHAELKEKYADVKLKLKALPASKR